eukprot:7171333-Prymnesium_polylepis.2
MARLHLFPLGWRDRGAALRRRAACRRAVCAGQHIRQAGRTALDARDAMGPRGRRLARGARRPRGRLRARGRAAAAADGARRRGHALHCQRRGRAPSPDQVRVIESFAGPPTYDRAGRACSLGGWR